MTSEFQPPYVPLQQLDVALKTTGFALLSAASVAGPRWARISRASAPSLRAKGATVVEGEAVTITRWAPRSPQSFHTLSASGRMKRGQISSAKAAASASSVWRLTPSRNSLTEAALIRPRSRSRA